MGIDNFCKLIGPIAQPSFYPASFDSVLVDCQSFLYVAIEHCLQTEEEKIFEEICDSVWGQVEELLKKFLSYTFDPITFILSFDGEGVPMKWSTQRERRRSKKSVSKKAFYRYVLFGENKLTNRVETYIIDRLKTFHRPTKIVLCGCNVPGEGEHKIFQLAEALKEYRNPIVVSVDQDVFVLSFLRLDRYQSIQIYRYNQFYNVTRFVSNQLPYPLSRLIVVSFLFGNDFIPALTAIRDSNPTIIHECLASIDEDDDPPTIISQFIENMKNHIRFSLVEFVDAKLMVCFWTTYFWILDYYTVRTFPQQFLENRVYDAFDRNQLLTGLTDKKFSKETFRKAKANYRDSITQPVPDAARHVFVDSEDLVNRLKSYWIESNSEHYTVMRIRGSTRETTESRRFPIRDSEKTRGTEKTEKGRKWRRRRARNSIYDPSERVGGRGRVPKSGAIRCRRR